MAAGSPDRVCVGVIAGVHGVRGRVRIKSFTEQPGDIFAYGPLSDEAGARRFEPIPDGHSKGQLLARIEGIKDRDAAEALKGTRLFVDRSILPEPEEDEFYIADLEGLMAEDATGRPVGEIKAVHDFGAGTMLEIAPEQGETFMIPFTKAAVPEIDLQGRRVVVEPPPEVLASEEADDGE